MYVQFKKILGALSAREGAGALHIFFSRLKNWYWPPELVISKQHSKDLKVRTFLILAKHKNIFLISFFMKKSLKMCFLK